MCGIIGYVGPRQAQSILLDGLKQLEYRGYDSAGIAILGENGEVAIRRDVGKLVNLQELMEQVPASGNLGMGHTRWATHGEPSRRNAHPHVSMGGQVVIVHNGIVENFVELREELAAEGVIFHSDTDSEVIAQLIERQLGAGLDLENSVRSTLGRLVGANSVVVLGTKFADRLICARVGNAGGIAIGVGDGEMFIASDIPAILSHTRQMIFLENRQMATITSLGYFVTELDGQTILPEIHTISWDPVSAAKEPYKHFMQKEIFEQPRALIDTLRGRVDFDKAIVTLPELNLTVELALRMKRLIIVACGTSYYAGLIGKQMIESLARIPVEVDYGSEFRHSDPVIDEDTVVLCITQSGETADTLAACELARSRGATLWSIVNVMGSQAMRMADGYILMHAGPEIGVASTKAFTTSLADLYLLACYLGQTRSILDQRPMHNLVSDLAHLPDLAGQVLENDMDYQLLANQYFKAENMLFIGRGINYPVALEGALKLKEISYIHAEGYPAGEMKHGPIALIDEEMPVFAIATKDGVYQKMISQVEQAKARGGRVIALATEGDVPLSEKVDSIIYVPLSPPLLAPIINTLPLQLFSYHVAVRRGCDVDQPRNLAKSVTVE
jgi:glucosamine--fructose-6-phosphate aminotransferase (isomerizing)